MGLKQLHYTSCERGLSGFAGFQFSAASGGVPPAVMRRVEELTAYEPPRSLPYEPTDAEIAACPASLTHAPGGDGEADVLAHVVFAGADFSQRLGNYFAHALASTDLGADLGGRLPIELWGSPLWARSVAGPTELPELAGPPEAGTVAPEAVRAFLAGHERVGWLPALLSAAATAVVNGDRSVVLVEPDATANASWIGAISYLLPPPLARRMSFTTYHFRPSYCPLHVVGTVPGADLEPGEVAVDSYWLFDVPGDLATGVEVHPLADLLVRVGVTAAPALWRRALAVAGDGTGDSLDAWHPPAAAVAAELGVELTGTDLDAAAGWLAGAAGRLQPETLAPLLDAVLDQPDLAERHRGALPSTPSAPSPDGRRGTGGRLGRMVAVRPPRGPKARGG